MTIQLINEWIRGSIIVNRTIAFGDDISYDFDQYPITLDHERLEIDVYNSSYRIPPSEIINNLILISDDYSTIFNIYESDNEIKLFLEKGHVDPWGERVSLYQTLSGHCVYMKFRNNFYFVSVKTRHVRLEYGEYFERMFERMIVPEFTFANLWNFSVERTKNHNWHKQGF